MRIVERLDEVESLGEDDRDVAGVFWCARDTYKVTRGCDMHESWGRRERQVEIERVGMDWQTVPWRSMHGTEMTGPHRQCE